jgi:hypothetical protein
VRRVTKIVSLKSCANVCVAQKDRNGCGWRPVHSCVVDDEQDFFAALLEKRPLVIRYSISYALTLNRLDLRIGTRGRGYSSAEKLTDEDGHISGGRRIRRRSDC